MFKSLTIIVARKRTADGLLPLNHLRAQCIWFEIVNKPAYAGWRDAKCAAE